MPNKINRKHLLWIVPITVILGFILGCLVMAGGYSNFMTEYPIIQCIYEMDSSLHPQTNTMPFTIDSQQQAIEWRCAKQYVNFSINDYKNIFVMR